MEPKRKVTTLGKDMKKLKPLCSVGGILKRCNRYGKQYEGSSKNIEKKIHTGLRVRSTLPSSNINNSMSSQAA